MSRRITVIGAGASAAHFALSLLEQGLDVEVVDVGKQSDPIPHPDASFDVLKDRLPDASRYFLGERLQGAVLPEFDDEYYGLPPSKDYAFEPAGGFRFNAEGFAPLVSFARGGLAEAWTAGAYTYTREEFGDFAFPYDELLPYYDLIAQRIGVTGEDDDLSRFMPVHAHLLRPTDLDPHSAALVARYRNRRTDFHALGCYLGRSRVAVLTSKKDDREACDYLGRCLYGCPRDALYSPAATLRICERFPGFRYRSSLYVSHFRFDGDRRIRSLTARDVNTGELVELPVDHVVLAAGTLSSGRIFLESFRRKGEQRTLSGLMDNRQIFVPFLTWRMLGKRPNVASYQYHQLAIGFEARNPAEQLHGQITTLKSALVHPLLSGLPVDFRTALRMFRHLHGALGLVNLNMSDTRRPTNTLSLAAAEESVDADLVIRYSPPANEADRLATALKKCKKAVSLLGATVPPGMVHVRPMGASVHYAGTLPMSHTDGPFTTTPEGRSRDFQNLHVVDGSIFPYLSAKQLTFTMMANAARIAAREFRSS